MAEGAGRAEVERPGGLPVALGLPLRPGARGQAQGTGAGIQPLLRGPPSNGSPAPQESVTTATGSKLSGLSPVTRSPGGASWGQARG